MRDRVEKERDIRGGKRQERVESGERLERERVCMKLQRRMERRKINKRLCLLPSFLSSSGLGLLKILKRLNLRRLISDLCISSQE